MKALTKFILVDTVILVVSVAVAGTWWAMSVAPAADIVVQQAAPGTAFSYGDHAAALKAYVDDKGMVNYKGLKADSKRLDTFLGQLAALDPKVYGGWSEKAKIAFWTNAYNAITLKVIIANYPIKSSFFKSVAYPKNSIRQISGAWDGVKSVVMGKKMTLDEIEHTVLRKEFNEPRIHMALVCAAMSCPPLRNEPFTGGKLDAQLKDQTVTFLKHPKKFQIDRKAGDVGLSPIFKWFGKDFVKTYGTGKAGAEAAVVKFIGKHLDKAGAEYLATGKYDVEYLDYDWTLNEQAGK
jgi:uncharacterized protein DUF547